MKTKTEFTSLAGRTCVITGGAGVLGRTISDGLASAGIRVAILDINAEQATSLARNLTETHNVSCIGIQADVLSNESLTTALSLVKREFGTVDFLINGAGGNSPKATTAAETYQPAEAQQVKDGKSFFELDQAGFEFVFDLNFLGTLLPTQVFAEEMANRGCGAILNISSMNSFRPLTRIPAYSAAKASVNNFTQWLAVHLATTGVRVNAIAPGFFMTEQNRFLLTDPATGEATPRGKKIILNTPMGRYGKPEDLIGAVLFLLSDHASFITGIILPVDGGYSAFGGV
jgi:NAD(P)-dependent dehydrogenase (short-subunit alcohol dehydrogenase family)